MFCFGHLPEICLVVPLFLIRGIGRPSSFHSFNHDIIKWVRIRVKKKLIISMRKPQAPDVLNFSFNEKISLLNSDILDESMY